MHTILPPSRNGGTRDMATLQRCGNRLNCDKGSGAGAESNDIAIVYFIGNLFGYSAFRIEILDLSRPSKFAIILSSNSYG